MKKIIITATAILTLAACGVNKKNTTPLDRSVQPKAAPAKESKIGDHKEFTLENGMKVFVIENSKLPTISYSLSFNIDPITEGDKAGYTSLVGDLIEAGTKNRTKKALNEEIDFIGANLGAYSSGVYTSGLSKYNEKLIGILADVTLNPLFPKDELEKKITETLTNLKASQTDAGAIMSDIKGAVLYGKKHPYGEFMTEATLKNITLEDCKNHYNSYFKPNNALLTIVGDISKKEAEKLVKKYFGEWKKGTVPTTKIPMPKEPTKPQVYIANKEGAVQSNIQISNITSLKVGDPDYEATKVFNQIFGSGFAGRLFQNLREDKEYTYGAYGGIRGDKFIGNFSSSAKVRNSVTDSAIEQFLIEINKIRNENVTAEELQNAKNYLFGTFAQGLESPRTIASFAANIERYNLDKDYYKNYLKRIDAVTAEDIKRIANKHLKPNNINIIVVGDAAEIGEKLAKFGDLHYLDREANEIAAPAKASKIPEGLTAQKVIEDYIKAVGGETAINSIKTMKAEYSTKFQGRDIQILSSFAFPNKVTSKSIMSAGGRSMVFQEMIYNGSKAKRINQGQELPSSKEIDEETNIESHLIPELVYSKLNVKTELVGTKVINSKQSYEIKTTYPSGRIITQFYDIKTGLKLRETTVEKSPQGDFTKTKDFSNYKATSGVMIPQSYSESFGPMKMEIKLDKIEMNKPIDNSVFKI